MLAAVAAGMAIVLGLLWFSARAAITICSMVVTNGKLKVVRGGIAPRVLGDVRDVVRRPRVKYGTIRIERAKSRARVITSGGFSKEQIQQLRNVIGTVPLAQLTNANKV